MASVVKDPIQSLLTSGATGLVLHNGSTTGYLEDGTATGDAAAASAGANDTFTSSHKHLDAAAKNYDRRIYSQSVRR